MIPKRAKAEQKAPKVPAYIVTFSDMVTLLLTFFVMLLTLAKVQDPELFNTGRDAFRLSIRNYGLGMLFGRRVSPDLGEVKTKYFIKESDKIVELRTIDARREDVRRKLKKIKHSMDTMPSQIVAKTTNFSVTNISFSPGDTVLNKPAENFLKRFCLDLQQSAPVGAVRLYVLGLAGQERTEQSQWILSAKRAQAAADFLNRSLPSELNWPVYSWGAGPGGHWISQKSAASSHSQILIAVLRADE